MTMQNPFRYVIIITTMVGFFPLLNGGVKFMSKNVRLADIYIKIYNKKNLTMDDLTFLAKYDPECFAKTCQNLVYNIPETKKLMQPETETKEIMEEALEADTVSEMDKMELLLENLKKMEELPVQKVSADRVKDLLGNLYMEMLFPHNGTNQYFKMENDNPSVFNKKV